MRAARYILTPRGLRNKWPDNWPRLSLSDLSPQRLTGKEQIMTQTKFSQVQPGPWSYNRDEGGTHGHVISTGDFIICDLPDAGDGAAPHTGANARLIAAASELLAALKTPERYLERFFLLAIEQADDRRYAPERDALERARSAIDNATCLRGQIDLASMRRENGGKTGLVASLGLLSTSLQKSVSKVVERFRLQQPRA